MRKHIRTNLLLFLAALFASPLFGGTLLDQNGDRMRATPIIIGGASGLTNSVNYATDYNNWITLRDVYKLNTVRLCWVDPYYEDHGWPHWTLSQAAPYIDQCVQNAANAGMNIIINYHNTAENQEIKDQYGNVIAPIDLTRNQQERLDFWTLMANSYANDSHVYFELVNEPVWSYGFYTDTVFK
ncbi:MAG: cellulase family glycosylhydrolase, partial [Verrucomicrobiota bacterium]